MPKRKNQATKPCANPLSDARKVQDPSLQDKSSEPSSKNHVEPPSKADLKAKQLWHRKSGIGYDLFVEYYGNQPKGVVYDDSDQISPQSSSVNDTSKYIINKQGKGMSRASKRRKKKNSTKQTEQHVKAFKVADNGQSSPITNSLSPKFEAVLRDKPDYRVISNMLSSMSVALPLTLRIRHPSFMSNTLKSDAEKVVKQLDSRFANLVHSVNYDATRKTIYQAKPSTGLSKFSLGKISPELKSLIIEATASGMMARQELGSMLPVIALVGVGKLKYGSKVLDMCACPGSKTLQALEVIATPTSQSPERKPGKIVANDVHPLRLDSLKDAVRRSGIPSALTDRIVYTNHDASKFPTPKSGKLFDCVIVDVPCSGDGTIRKDPHILPGWMPSISNSLHGLQMSILKRSIKLLKVGGVVAFSTCSMNPIEDEAVVASALSWANRFQDGTVELLDWPETALPGFKRRPGVKSWRVGSYHWENTGNESDGGDDVEDMQRIQWYDTFEDANSDNMPHASPTMWPCSPESPAMSCLQKCTRLLPQDNDTGGFFVVLMKKNREIENQFTSSTRTHSSK